MSHTTLRKFAPVIFLLLWSDGFTVAKVGIAGAEPMTLLALRYGCVVLLMLPFFLYLKPTLPIAAATETMHIKWSWSFAGALFYLVVCYSLLAISLLLMMIGNGEATRVSALFFLVPPVSAIIALAMLQEPISWLGWLGMAVAATGMWFAKNTKQKV